HRRGRRHQRQRRRQRQGSRGHRRQRQGRRRLRHRRQRRRHRAIVPDATGRLSSRVTPDGTTAYESGREASMARRTGKVAIIAGGSGGIGRAAARLFVEEGARVLLVDLNEAALREATAAAVHGADSPDAASYAVADTTQPDQVEGFIKTAVERYGGV